MLVLCSREMNIRNRLVDFSYDYIKPICQSNQVIGTTPFSLPFMKWRKEENQDKRNDWLLSRKIYWKDGLRRSLQNLENPFGNICWLIFMARGDRKKLSFPQYEVLENGIWLYYIEVTDDATCDDDFIRYTVPTIINRYANLNPNNSATDLITLRVDSDDTIDKNYLKTIAYVIKTASNKVNTNEIIFSFCNGLEFDYQTKYINPKIWPESPFLVRQEKIVNNKPFKTVWQFDHDSYPEKMQYANLITNKPLWCMTLHGNNLMNQRSNGYDLRKKYELKDLFNS